ncbi:sterol desaturase family protein [Flexithrix dorotheae]|uniref:sterol desaturase family protein n=1 Tax=Flexithrix dorotheae TaxID=70993 RepID=UPI00036B6052|nr:sterol desaturase family protein [Flexithrix dorotheae]
MEITNPLIFGVPCFILLIIIEIIFSLKYDRELYQWKDFAASTSMGAGAVVLAIFTKSASLAAFFVVYEIFNPEVDGVRTNIMGYAAFGWAWYLWIICQVLDDFNYYWYHRLSHTVRVLWAAHVVHHSSDNFNLGSGIRNGWVTLFYKPIFWLYLPAIGFHPIMVTTCLAIQALWQFQLHTKFVPRLGFIEKFMNTHKHHHVHHSSDIEYLDKNHGGYLNLFDKIFGTFKDLDDDKEVHFGVLHPPNSYNPFVIVSHEYKHIWQDVKKSKNIKEAFMYVFGPPGWSPDGSSLTVKQMQRELEKNGTISMPQPPKAASVAS